MIAAYPKAVQLPADHRRVGGPIAARGITVHTTDTLVGSLDAIAHSWQTTPGKGECAHVIIGADGRVVQLVPFDRNGNHAGGTACGAYHPPDAPAQGFNPNSVTIGIELEAPGYLRLAPVGTPARWLHTDTGHRFTDAQVYIEQGPYGTHRAWGLIPDAQLTALGALLDWLDPQLALSPLGPVSTAGTYKDNSVQYGAVPAGARVVGHVTSNPIQKTDPGPQVMAWIAARGYR